MKTIIVTGGSGFIGSAMVKSLIDLNYSVINIDKLSYASHPNCLDKIKGSKKYFFEKADICNKKLVNEIFDKYSPDGLIHFAAESHVDNSISNPDLFIESNIVGTLNLLEATRLYFKKIDHNKKNNFRFLHISTDEVFGDLKKGDSPFDESNKYFPSSPYSASKASSDHLVSAWNRTFDIPTIISNCSNNYGPFQNGEKLIPKTILNAIKGKKIPIYGNGNQIRDWLYVQDHIEALILIFNKGKIGETFNIGGKNELRNIQVVSTICEMLDKKVIQKPKNLDSFFSLVEFVSDRPGHDKRYAINSEKISFSLGWSPKESFQSGIEKTVNWYLDNLETFNE